MLIYLIYLSWLFFLSELLLMLIKRSGKGSSKVQRDKGSLALLWVTITLCFSLGFTFAFRGIWALKGINFYFLGLFFIFIGLAIRWISIIQLKKAFTVDVAIGAEQKLTTDGLYKLVRHPSYLGLLLIMTGFSISMGNFISILAIVIPMFLVIHYRILVEEKVLVEAFGDTYISYQATTRRLIPWLY